MDCPIHRESEKEGVLGNHRLQKIPIILSMRGKVRKLTRKVRTALPSRLQWAVFLVLLWLAYQLGIYERVGGVGALVLALVALVVGTIFMNYVRLRFRARGRVK